MACETVGDNWEQKSPTIKHQAPQNSSSLGVGPFTLPLSHVFFAGRWVYTAGELVYELVYNACITVQNLYRTILNHIEHSVIYIYIIIRRRRRNILIIIIRRIRIRKIRRRIRIITIIITITIIIMIYI